MTSAGDFTELRASVAETARQVAARGLVLGSAGNVSARDGDAVAVTASGVHLSDATVDDVTVVDLDGHVIKGALRPTTELEMHLGIYRSTSNSSVVHAHSMSTVALSLVADELPPVHYQQLLLGGAIPVVPFAAFGSEQLATSTVAALAHHNAVILAHHGSVTVGQSPTEALDRIVLLEWLCEVYLRAAAVQQPRALTPADLQAVIEMAIATQYGETRRV
ncbi:Putative L-ribulose-5-phosphate 4-epimerase [Prescottella defluvii]|uniref:class II aldolase/adducin family protein n=1 Tax=Prescottella defluvii TaxID=1323361 RepID=UPI0004F250ED|nr:class II aldolase/adducin family protein [Prescottella defluvii]